MSAKPHFDDIFHVIIDAIDILLDSEERQPWEGYDEGVSPMGDPEGYMATVRDARAFATAALDRSGRSMRATIAAGCTGYLTAARTLNHDRDTCPIHGC